MDKELLNEMERLSRESIETFGAAAQIDKTIEELQELITELMETTDPRGVKPDHLERIRDEVADVLVTAMHMRVLFGAEHVDARIHAKLARLERIMNGEGK